MQLIAPLQLCPHREFLLRPFGNRCCTLTETREGPEDRTPKTKRTNHQHQTNTLKKRHSKIPTGDKINEKQTYKHDEHSKDKTKREKRKTERKTKGTKSTRRESGRKKKPEGMTTKEEQKKAEKNKIAGTKGEKPTSSTNTIDE